VKRVGGILEDEEQGEVVYGKRAKFLKESVSTKGRAREQN
jgi:hypothetical protein